MVKEADGVYKGRLSCLNFLITRQGGLRLIVFTRALIDCLKGQYNVMSWYVYFVRVLVCLVEFVV